jgi:hypothetical protein
MLIPSTQSRITFRDFVTSQLERRLIILAPSFSYCNMLVLFKWRRDVETLWLVPVILTWIGIMQYPATGCATIVISRCKLWLLKRGVFVVPCCFFRTLLNLVLFWGVKVSEDLGLLWSSQAIIKCNTGRWKNWTLT